MNISHLIKAAAAIFIPAAGISAQASSFHELVENIVNTSPAIAAEEARMQSAIASERAANIPSDPEVEFEHLWNKDGGPNRWSVSVSQSIAWPGSYSARSGMISALAAQQAAGLATSRATVRNDAARLIVEIIAANKEIQILEEINGSMMLLREKIERAWNNGEATVLDVNKINIENLRSATRLEAAQNALSALTSELHALSGNDNNVNVPDDLDFPFASLQPLEFYENAMHNSPQWATAALTESVAERNRILAKTERMPGFSIGYNHAYEDGTHFNGISIGVTLPVWSRKQTMASATASALAARFDAISRHTEMTYRLHADHANADIIRKRMAIFAPSVEGTNNLSLLAKAYNGGELSLLNYLQEVNYFLEARLDYIALCKEYAILLTRLGSYSYATSPIN